MPVPISPNDVVNNLTNLKQITPPDYSGGIPNLLESVDLDNGLKLRRMTSSANGLNILYSRMSPENTSGEFFFAFGNNSTSCYVINRKTGDIVLDIVGVDGKQVGENNEVRWDISGNQPNRLTFNKGMGFFEINDVTNPQPSLIHDFSSEFPNSTRLYNDVEGDCSDDSDVYGWMAAHYEGGHYRIDAFVNYRVSTGEMNSITPSDFAGTELDFIKNEPWFPVKPNMVEISPKGDRFITHFGRKWDDSSYGGNGIAYIGTVFDGPRAWKLDFSDPIKIAVGEEHSGWGFDEDGNQVFVHPNSRTDFMESTKVEDVDDYATRLRLSFHGDIGWANGVHLAKMPPHRKGFILVSTYASENSSSYGQGWAENALYMQELKENGSVIPLGSTYNKYTNYRSEAATAINRQGNRAWFSCNFGGLIPHVECFCLELPEDWDGPKVVEVPNPVITGVSTFTANEGDTITTPIIITDLGTNMVQLIGPDTSGSSISNVGGDNWIYNAPAKSYLNPTDQGADNNYVEIIKVGNTEFTFSYDVVQVVTYPVPVDPVPVPVDGDFSFDIPFNNGTLIISGERKNVNIEIK